MEKETTLQQFKFNFVKQSVLFMGSSCYINSKESLLTDIQNLIMLLNLIVADCVEGTYGQWLHPWRPSDSQWENYG